MTPVFTRATLALAQVLAVVVCLTLRLSQVKCSILKLNVGWRKQRHTIAQASSYLMPKTSAELKGSYPQRKRHMQVG